jgi:indolepyruvate ferredoxin oxidoreductase beta subunit
MEALRWLEYLKPGGSMIVNDFEIPSVPILLGAARYPAGILEELSQKVKIHAIKATERAEALGNAKIMNIVLLGALVKTLGLTDLDWKGVIRASVKKGFEDLNIRAFEEGGHML